jgi:alpha-D-ribose 1-methylphosphonate 5-triphosphate diphosphatase
MKVHGMTDMNVHGMTDMNVHGMTDMNVHGMTDSNGWLENAQIVLPDQTLECGSLRLEDGFIAEILVGRPKSGSGIDLQGGLLIPGIVDIHGDMIERELEPRPGTQFPVQVALDELDKRYASNGITTAYAAIALADGPGLRTEERAEKLVQAICDSRAGLGVDLRTHLRLEVLVQSGVALLERLLHQNQVQMVSLMDHTPGQGQFRDLEYYVRYMTKWLGGDEQAAKATAQAYLETPVSWQVAQGVCALAKTRAIPIASHDDDTAQKVQTMQQLGVSIAEFPVTRKAAQAAADAGMNVVMGAPNALRGGSHSGNLSALEGIHAGVVHGLCADYHPASLLHAALRLVREGMALHKAVGYITTQPAKAAGLADRGGLVVGSRADLVLVKRERVAATWRGGHLIYAQGALSG